MAEVKTGKGPDVVGKCLVAMADAVRRGEQAYAEVFAALAGVELSRSRQLTKREQAAEAAKQGGGVK